MLPLPKCERSTLITCAKTDLLRCMHSLARTLCRRVSQRVCEWRASVLGADKRKYSQTHEQLHWVGNPVHALDGPA